MTAMFAAARWMMVLGLMVSIGLHTVVIQSAAWAGMLVSYSMKSGSVAQAVSETFDGEHPCKLCKLAQQQQAEKEPASGNQAPKVDGKLKVHLIAEVMPAIVISAPPPNLFTTADEMRLCELYHALDTPPPRRLTA